MRTALVKEKHEPTGSVTLNIDDQELRLDVTAELFEGLDVGATVSVPGDFEHPSAKAAGWLRWSF